MKPRRVYTDYLRDILDAAEKTERFVAGLDLAAFESDDKTTFAVIRALEQPSQFGLAQTACR